MEISKFPHELVNKHVEVVKHDRLNNQSKSWRGMMSDTKNWSGRVSFFLTDLDGVNPDMEFNVQSIDEINEVVDD